MTPDAASERFDEYVRRWRVSVERVTKTETSLIAFGERDARAVVLKVARGKNGEWRSGELLTGFGGAGMVHALELGDGAVLLERLDPGNDLSTLVMSNRDDEATKILAGVIARMRTVRPSVPGVMTASISHLSSSCIDTIATA